MKPKCVDRLIIHQFDPLRPSPGGIDTCLRGIARYAPPGVEIAFVGVDATNGGSPERLGSWEIHRFGDRHIYFLPVVSLDPSDQRRRVPHSLRLMTGLIRYRQSVPSTHQVNTHRMDTALISMLMWRVPLIYYIHSQQGGIAGTTSDSFWRFAGPIHHWLEKLVVSKAADVVVFNQQYARAVKRWNPAARFCPTWFDPALLGQKKNSESSIRDPYQVVWLGRLEAPKDPTLALSSFAMLAKREPTRPWRLEMLGNGSLLGSVQKAVSNMEPEVAERITVHGRVEPSRVASILSSAGLFLMTSHPGYEGYPTVLVESLAAGLPAVVTNGSDTGGLIVNGENGFVTDRSPETIVARLQKALVIDRCRVAATVRHLEAPSVVGRLFDTSKVSS